MSHKGKIQLMFIFVASPDQVAEGDRIFRSHGPWMEATHHRTGDKTLLSYNLSKHRSFPILWIATLPQPATLCSS